MATIRRVSLNQKVGGKSGKTRAARRQATAENAHDNHNNNDDGPIPDNGITTYV